MCAMEELSFVLASFKMYTHHVLAVTVKINDNFWLGRNKTTD